MIRLNVISALKRAPFSNPFQNILGIRNIATTPALLFQTTPCLLAEPLKKKKKLDPAIVRAREEKKKRRIEKQIRRLEKSARQLKPIEECEVPLSLLDEKKQRLRKLPALSAEVLEQRALLFKQWSTYKMQKHLSDVRMLDRIEYAQQRALDELKKESEELYEEAVQLDALLLPYTTEGPLHTPPIENYEVPDGDYQDVSKKWDN